MKNKLLILALTLILTVNLTLAFSTEISEPDSTYEHDTTQDITIKWFSENDENYGRERTAKLIIEDENSNEVEEQMLSDSVPSNTEVEEEYTVDVEDLAELSEGNWDIIVTEIWEQTEDEFENTISEERSEDYVGIQTVEEEDNRVEEDGSYSQTLTEPGENYFYKEGDELDIVWGSENGFGSERTLEQSEVKVYDQEGGEYAQTVNRDSVISAESSDSKSVSISSSDLQDLEFSEEWAVQVIDYWEDETIDNYAYFDTETSSEEENDGASDNDSDGEEDDVIIDDGDSEETASEDESVNDSDSGENDSEESESPEETEEDSGEELEDDQDTGSEETETEEENNSTTGSESGSDQDDSQESENQSGNKTEQTDNTDEEDSASTLQALDYGPVVSGVPLWIPFAILLISIVLFRRSDYEIDL